MVRRLETELPARSRGLPVAGHWLELRGQAVLVDGVLRPVSRPGMALLRALARRPGRMVDAGRAGRGAARAGRRRGAGEGDERPGHRARRSRSSSSPCWPAATGWRWTRPPDRSRSAGTACTGTPGDRCRPRLLLVAHGTRDPAGAVVTERVAARARQALGVPVAVSYVDVRRPTPADALAELPGPCVAVPMFLAAGYHVRVDVPAQLREYRPRRRGRRGHLRARPAAGRSGRAAPGRGRGRRAGRRGAGRDRFHRPARAGRQRAGRPAARPRAGPPGHAGHHRDGRAAGTRSGGPAAGRGRGSDRRGELAARARAVPPPARATAVPTWWPSRSPTTTRCSS